MLTFYFSYLVFHQLTIFFKFGDDLSFQSLDHLVLLFPAVHIHTNAVFDQLRSVSYKLLCIFGTGALAWFPVAAGSSEFRCVDYAFQRLIKTVDFVFHSSSKIVNWTHSFTLNCLHSRFDVHNQLFFLFFAAFGHVLRNFQWVNGSFQDLGKESAKFIFKY